MEVELNVECNACNATYTMMYESDDIWEEDPAFHCSFCGILMEPYYDEFFDED
jgi:hypothetical protein